jgi:hypothetical protein
MYLPKENKEGISHDRIYNDGPSGAVLKYGEKVLVTCETYYGFTAEVYEFVETPEETGLGYIECRLSLIEKAEKHFEDGGHAIAWCISRD